MKRLRVVVAALAVLAAAGAGGWYWLEQQQQRLPNDIALGNGRIEAQEIHVAAKYPGRLAEVLVEEGDNVEGGQVLARMDTTELDASLEEAKADIAQADQTVAEAKAEIARRE